MKKMILFLLLMLPALAEAQTPVSAIRFTRQRATALAACASSTAPCLRLHTDNTLHYSSAAVTDSAVASLGSAQTFTKAQRVAESALTDGANIATDATASNIFTVTLGGNRTLDNPTGLASGTYLWVITQDGTGTRTLAYGSSFKWPGGTAPTLTATAGAVDLISCVYTGTTLKCVFNSNFTSN